MAALASEQTHRHLLIFLASDAVKTARSIAARYPLVAAMKQIEAWRSVDDAWTRMAPPLLPLDGEQKLALKSDIDALG